VDGDAVLYEVHDYTDTVGLH